MTGRNSFFTFTDAQAAELGLRQHCVPLVSRSNQLCGLVYDFDCRASDLAVGQRTWLLDAPDEPAGQSSIEAGLDYAGAVHSVSASCPLAGLGRPVLDAAGGQGLTDEPLSHEQTLHGAERASGDLTRLLLGFLERIGARAHG